MGKACDVVFARIEAWLAARPTTRCCGCCCGLRAGTITACVFNALYFLGEMTDTFTLIAFTHSGVEQGIGAELNEDVTPDSEAADRDAESPERLDGKTSRTRAAQCMTNGTSSAST